MDGDAADMDITTLKNLADAGDGAAQHEYAWRLHSGTQGASLDHSEALRYLQMAAEQQRPESLVTLARILFLGDGIKADPARAVQLLKKAATRGYAWAQVELTSAFYMQLPSGTTAKWQRRLSLEPVPMARYTRCPQCDADARLRCSDCGIVKYCTPECQQAHYKHHEVECAVMTAWARDPLAPKVTPKILPRQARRWRAIRTSLFVVTLIAVVVAFVLSLPSVRGSKRPMLILD